MITMIPVVCGRCGKRHEMPYDAPRRPTEEFINNLKQGKPLCLRCTKREMNADGEFDGAEWAI